MTPDDALKALGGLPILQAIAGALMAFCTIWIMLRAERDKRSGAPPPALVDPFGTMNHFINLLPTLVEIDRQIASTLIRIEGQNERAREELIEQTGLIKDQTEEHVRLMHKVSEDLDKIRQARPWWKSYQ